jgi:hypothetical protein
VRLPCISPPFKANLHEPQASYTCSPQKSHPCSSGTFPPKITIIRFCAVRPHEATCRPRRHSARVVSAKQSVVLHALSAEGFRSSPRLQVEKNRQVSRGDNSSPPGESDDRRLASHICPLFPFYNAEQKPASPRLITSPKVSCGSISSGSNNVRGHLGGKG